MILVVNNYILNLILIIKKLIIGAVYLLPRTQSEIHMQHVQTVEKIYSDNADCDLILIGDYNVPKTTWTNYTDISEPLIANCTHHDSLILENSIICSNSFNYLNLVQKIKNHPIKGYTLDLCCTSLDFIEFENYNLDEILLPS